MSTRVYFPYLFDEVEADDLTYALTNVGSPFVGSVIEKVDMTENESSSGRGFKRAVVHFKKFQIAPEFESDFHAHRQCECEDYAMDGFIRQRTVRFIKYRKTENSREPVKPVEETRKPVAPPSSEWKDMVTSGAPPAASPYAKGPLRGETFGNLIYGLVASYIQMGATAPITPEEFQAMTGKITGMILELDYEYDFRACVQDLNVFAQRFKEAMELYKQQ